MKRRLTYYHHIIKRPYDELIYKFYKAQKLKPSKGDWVNLVENDKQLLKINLGDEEIAKMSKFTFKKFVKKVIAEGAFAYLMKIKETHSKLKDLKYKKLEMQNYIKSDNNLTVDEKCLLFQFRVRQTDVKCDYKTNILFTIVISVPQTNRMINTIYFTTKF